MKRRFRGLRSAPDPRYDAILIGSGVGGLVAGNLLVRAGLKVLLVEQHYMVGGYCSTFRRGGYTFDAATHFYPLLGNPDTITGRLLGELGVTTGWVKMDPVDTFHFPDGSRFEVPADLETYKAKVKAEFPDEAGALDAFFQEVKEVYFLGLLHYFRGKPIERGVAQMERLERLRHLTLGEVLAARFRDRKLRLLLAADCPHWGSRPGRTSFVFDSMLRLSYFLGNYYPKGGSQAFADELALRFEEQGGHLLTSAMVERIHVEKGAARGVDLELLRGPVKAVFPRGRIESEVVISNADLIQTYERLIGAENLPAETISEVRALRPTFPCWLTHLGLVDVTNEELERVQGYYWDGWDMDRVGIDALRFKLFAPTLYEPEMAPPGGQVLIIQKVMEMDYDRIDDWAKHKAEVEAFLFDHLGRLMPGIEKKIVARTSASAKTSARFTLNTSGAMLGWEMSPAQLGDGRPTIETPIDGLYCVGHWTRPGGGITPVIVSAQQAAQRVLAGRAE